MPPDGQEKNASITPFCRSNTGYGYMPPDGQEKNASITPFCRGNTGYGYVPPNGWEKNASITPFCRGKAGLSWYKLSTVVHRIVHPDGWPREEHGSLYLGLGPSLRLRVGSGYAR